jgi:hypothetical protein
MHVVMAHAHGLLLVLKTTASRFDTSGFCGYSLIEQFNSFLKNKGY